MACSFAGLGILSLGSGDFALNWQPVPEWVPWRQPLAYLSGSMLLAAGVGMLWRRTAALSTSLLAANLVMWLVLLRLPRVIQHPLIEVGWLGFSEPLVLVTGAWITLTEVAQSRS